MASCSSAFENVVSFLQMYIVFFRFHVLESFRTVKTLLWNRIFVLVKSILGEVFGYAVHLIFVGFQFEPAFKVSFTKIAFEIGQIFFCWDLRMCCQNMSVSGLLGSKCLFTKVTLEVFHFVMSVDHVSLQISKGHKSFFTFVTKVFLRTYTFISLQRLLFICHWKWWRFYLYIVWINEVWQFWFFAKFRLLWNNMDCLRGCWWINYSKNLRSCITKRFNGI